MKRLLLILVCLTFFQGCAAVRFESPSLLDAPTQNTITVRYYRFVWGLVPGSPVSLEQCGAVGMKKLKIKPNFIDGIITFATLGIVSPVRVKIRCAGKQSQVPQPQVPQPQVSQPPQPQK